MIVLAAAAMASATSPSMKTRHRPKTNLLLNHFAGFGAEGTPEIIELMQVGHCSWAGSSIVRPIMTPDPNHPVTDIGASFSAVHPRDTHRVMEALRQADIYFDVTINGPKDDPNSQGHDIFWFRPDDDQEHIGSIVRQASSGVQKDAL